jgi:hypothetical protein
MVNQFSMALLYGRAGRLTAQNGGFRPGQLRQWARSLHAAGERAEAERVGTWAGRVARGAGAVSA